MKKSVKDCNCHGEKNTIENNAHVAQTGTSLIQSCATGHIHVGLMLGVIIIDANPADTLLC